MEPSKQEYEIIEDGDRYKISHGNAVSFESFASYDEAKEACQQDHDAWIYSDDVEQYEDFSPITWEA